MINSSISECDHKCETRNAEAEIGTDGSSQTRPKPRVDGYGSGFGLPRVSWSGCWTGLELNRPVFAVQTRTAGGLPGPIANTSHGACLIPVQFPLLSFSAPCSLTPWLAVHGFSASGRLLHLKKGISWLLAEIAAFSLEVFFPATSSSWEIRLSPSISLSIPPAVSTQQIVRMHSPSSFIPVLIAPVFAVGSLRFFPLDSSPLQAHASLPLKADVRGHQDLHSVALEGVSRWSWTVVSTQSGGLLVLLAGRWRAGLVDGWIS